ncbi:phospholipase/carboxylesterase family protein-like protein [Pyrenochaeta sp. DS3sAY3a]|nr:phospholipase/carboxylesterase family protein-like protein [Pyrenochaeta sp. DS3sAY3a]
MVSKGKIRANVAASIVSEPPTQTHTHTIIFLHGRGSDATTFRSELFESKNSKGQFLSSIFPNLKWVFPCAKVRHVTGGLPEKRMPQWFDMTAVEKPQADHRVQEQGIKESTQQLLTVIKTEAEIVGSYENVIVAGLSQGCAIALYTLLKCEVGVGGFIGVSGWVPLANQVDAFMRKPGRDDDVLDTPVLLQHCEDDRTLPQKNGEDMVKQLRRLQMDVEWQCFKHGGHWLNEPEGVDSIVRFIKGIMTGEDSMETEVEDKGS